MYSIVMVCLLLVLMVSVPLPLKTDAKAFHIYPKASFSNIKKDALIDEMEIVSSEHMPEMREMAEMPIPSKRSTMLLNKLMHALHKALDNQNEEVAKDTPEVVPLIPDNYPMDLHRRGEDRLTRYWRCYFNAVSCF